MSNNLEFKLEGTDHIELNNLLKVLGLCATGGEAKNAIEQGQVSVNGSNETRKGLKLKPGYIITYAGKKIKIV